MNTEPSLPHAPPAQAPSLHDAALYANRELSQLDFNFRVLAQAQDPAVPLLGCAANIKNALFNVPGAESFARRINDPISLMSTDAPGTVVPNVIVSVAPPDRLVVIVSAARCVYQ